MTEVLHLTTLGKRWGLRRLADARGHFRILAIDQRRPVIQLIARGRGCAPEAVGYADIAAVKRLLAEELAPYATAMLADPNFSYPSVVDLLSPRSGLLVTLEDHRFEDTPAGRKSRTVEGWSVDRIKRIGADGVKVRLWYRPDAGAEVRAHQQAFVRGVGRDCAACDIPFVLELQLYPLAPAANPAADPAAEPTRHAELVLESVREFAQPDYRVDLLKLESPLPIAEFPGEDDPTGVAYLQATFDSLSQATGGLPWVLLSAGAAQLPFRNALRRAYRAGASGFLVGRAIWQAAMEAFPDIEACRKGLRSSAVSYMRELAVRTNTEAHDWAADYADLRGIDREGTFTDAVPPLGTPRPD